MSAELRPAPPRAVPTLTEVVQMTPPRLFGALPSALPVPADTEPVPPPSTAAAPPLDPTLTQRLLLDVQRQVDLLLEQRLRDTLAPLLARLADDLVRDARDQLAATLRELITQAVAREMAHRRP